MGLLYLLVLDLLDPEHTLLHEFPSSLTKSSNEYEGLHSIFAGSECKGKSGSIPSEPESTTPAADSKFPSATAATTAAAAAAAISC